VSGARSEQSGAVTDAGARQGLSAGDARSAVVSGIPGWGLRLVRGAAAAGATAVAMAAVPDIGVLSVAGVAMMLLVIGTAFAPGSVVPLLLLIGLVIYRLLQTGPVLDVGLAVLVLLLPLIHQLAGIAGAIPPQSRCDWRVLRPAGLRYLMAVLPVEIVLLVAAVVM
jgi:phosphate:Na+ symporter